MNLYDMTDRKPAASADAQTPAEGSRDETDFWRDLVLEIGRETAAPLTTALERVLTLSTTGQIDREGLDALRREIEHARRTGMASQQLARLAAGGVRQAHEKLNLGHALQDLLATREKDFPARGLKLKQVLRVAEVIVDATLLFALLDSILDWSLEHARTTVELRIEMKTWPNRARLTCRFAHRYAGADNAPAPATIPVEDLGWRLLKQTARTMGLGVEYQFDDERASVTLEFPRTVNSEMSGVSAFELDQGFSSTTSGAKPLAGSHVLVIASRRDVRVQVREAIRNMGLVVDFVNSVDEAVAFCNDALPQAIVFESVLRGERLDDLFDRVQAEKPDFVFIEIIEEGSTFEMSGFSGTGFSRVGRDAILTALPSALVFELSRAL
jgi:hypothetical protein